MSLESMANSSTQRFDHLYQLLTKQISNSLSTTGTCETAIDNLQFFRRDLPTEPEHCLIEPSVVLVSQGRKQMVMGNNSYPYDPSKFLITSLDLPISSQVVEASPDKPNLGLVLKLDIGLLTKLVAENAHLSIPNNQNTKSVGLGTITAELLEPFVRLLGLINEPESIAALSPMIIREIHYRLLQSDQAGLLRQIAAVDSHSSRISKAINWIKTNYSSAFKIEDLASKVQMSAPTFHQHFRELTSMSPLQYQKWLRLNEARRLMLNESVDASTAGFQVGYESPSQFSREYRRLFGAPPKKDIDMLRRGVTGTAEMAS